MRRRFGDAIMVPPNISGALNHPTATMRRRIQAREKAVRKKISAAEGFEWQRRAAISIRPTLWKLIVHFVLGLLLVVVFFSYGADAADPTIMPTLSPTATPSLHAARLPHKNALARAALSVMP